MSLIILKDFMENWLLIAIAGYLLLAIEAVIAKILLTSKVKDWRLYSFYVGLLSLTGVFLRLLVCIGLVGFYS